jgi:hypothetical protein
MLYQPALLAAALDCDTAALKVEYGLYNRAKTLSKAFRAATDWGRSGSGSGSGVKPRFDYTLQGATAARLPAVFFAHAGTEGGRSIDDRSVHTAFCNIFSDHLPVFVDLEFARNVQLRARPQAQTDTPVALSGGEGRLRAEAGEIGEAGARAAADGAKKEAAATARDKYAVAVAAARALRVRLRLRRSTQNVWRGWRTEGSV